MPEQFLVSAIRAVIEMLLLALIAQGTLFVLAGKGRDTNPIYRLFAIITCGPLRLVARLLPDRLPASAIAIFTFLVLVLAWLGLAIIRKSL